VHVMAMIIGVAAVAHLQSMSGTTRRGGGTGMKIPWKGLTTACTAAAAGSSRPQSSVLWARRSLRPCGRGWRRRQHNCDAESPAVSCWDQLPRLHEASRPKRSAVAGAAAGTDGAASP
jgi:hypothetical protein